MQLEEITNRIRKFGEYQIEKMQTWFVMTNDKTNERSKHATLHDAEVAAARKLWIVLTKFYYKPNVR